MSDRTATLIKGAPPNGKASFIDLLRASMDFALQRQRVCLLPRVLHVAVDGDIGAGKSLLLDRLRDAVAVAQRSAQDAGPENVLRQPEPHEHYTAAPAPGADSRTVDMVGAMYAGELDGAAAQMYIAAAHAAATRATLGYAATLAHSAIVLIERSPRGNAAFARVRCPDVHAPRACAYHHVCAALDAPVPHVIVRLRAPHALALQRIAARGRPAESAVDAPYLARVADAYAALGAEPASAALHGSSIELDFDACLDASTAEYGTAVRDLAAVLVSLSAPAAAPVAAPVAAPAAVPAP